MRVISKVNALLKKAGREERLIRGKGYYYLSACEDSMLCVYLLEEGDLELAKDHVESVLSAKDGQPFSLVPQPKGSA